MTLHDDATLADISSSLCCEPIVRTPRDCLHILAGQIAGDYVLHLEFVPSSVHLSHRCGLFVIVEPAGAVALRGDQLYTFRQHTALTIAGSVFDYFNQPLGSPPIDRTTAEFPVALCEGVVFRIVGQLRPGHTIPRQRRRRLSAANAVGQGVRGSWYYDLRVTLITPVPLNAETDNLMFLPLQ